MSQTFTRTTRIPGVEPTVVFDLSLDVDLHVASMADSGEQAVQGVTSGQLGPGDEVTWRARHFGVPWRMRVRITEWEPPHRFVDEQVRGPFRAFRHEHRFEAAGGGTVMTDVVSLTAPFGALGRLVERAGLGSYLERLIDRRGAVIRTEAAGGGRPAG